MKKTSASGLKSISPLQSTGLQSTAIWCDGDWEAGGGKALILASDRPGPSPSSALSGGVIPDLSPGRATQSPRR